jgi:DNA-binding transcriptional LysR family regulator
LADLKNLNMNLLKVLDALIKEQNVTRAGERLGRTQPAISNALNRLRKLLDDELLVRGSGGLTLTPRAEALRDPLNDIMQLAEICLSEGIQFDPMEATGILRIGLPDRLSLSVLPLLVKKLSDTAPGLGLHVKTADRDQTLSLFENDEIDLALGWPENLPPHLRSEWLFDEELVCVCRRGHPVLSRTRPFDTKALVSFPHVVVSATGGQRAVFDNLLSDRGLERKGKVFVPGFSAVPELLRSSNMLAVFTRGLAVIFGKSHGLEHTELPLDLGPLGHFMVWPARYDSDPRHVWYREQIRSVCGTLDARAD